jgi:hypothetical protein
VFNKAIQVASAAISGVLKKARHSSYEEEIRADERRRCARICEAMVVGGRAWNDEQRIAAHALLAAAHNIRDDSLDVRAAPPAANRNV